MKKRSLIITVSVVISVLLSGCASMMSSMELSNAKNRLKEHSYGEALNLAVSALAYSENKNTEAADLIVEIVAKGDDYYNELIQKNRASNEGNALAKIYNNYLNLSNLYATVINNGLQNFTVEGNKYSIEVIDYSAELNAARDEAAQMYYKAAVVNMEKNTLAGYRQAYYNLDFVRTMYSGMESPFTDLDSRLQTAYNMGTIDVYVVVPADLEMDAVGESMGDIFKSYVTTQSDWVKFHYGNEIDTAYQLWEVSMAGEAFMDSLSGIINDSNGVLEFGQEIGADIVMYAAYDKLNSEAIKKTDHSDSFSGTSAEGEEYIMKLSWQKYSKKTSVNCSYFVVDVESGKTLAQNKNTKLTKDIVLYNGTYTITPDVWFSYSTRNFAELLKIDDIREYRYIQAGYNGYAYRVGYDSSEMIAMNKDHFDENTESYVRNAESEALFMIAKQTAEEAAAVIADLF